MPAIRSSGKNFIIREAVSRACQKSSGKLVCETKNICQSYQRVAQLSYPLEEDTAIPAEEFCRVYLTNPPSLGVVIWNKIYRAALVKQYPIPPLSSTDDVAWMPYFLSYAERGCRMW